MTPDTTLLNYLCFDGTDDNWTAVLSPEPWSQAYHVIAGDDRDYGYVRSYKEFFNRTADVRYIRSMMASEGLEEATDVGPGSWARSVILSMQLIMSGGQFMPTVSVEGHTIHLNWAIKDTTG